MEIGEVLRESDDGDGNDEQACNGRLGATRCCWPNKSQFEVSRFEPWTRPSPLGPVAPPLSNSRQQRLSRIGFSAFPARILAASLAELTWLPAASSSQVLWICVLQSAASILLMAQKVTAGWPVDWAAAAKASRRMQHFGNVFSTYSN